MSYAREKWLKKKHKGRRIKIEFEDDCAIRIENLTRRKISDQAFQLLEDFVNKVFR
ncbi:MAG: hypothetical protein ABIK73_08615 [candidate division WOR-3 bacterium]